MKKINLNYKNIEIPLLYEFDNSMPVVNFKLVFRASGICSEKKYGLAKICAKILSEGTKTLGVGKFCKDLEIKAIDIHSYVGFEAFGIEINSLKEHFDYAFLKLCELLKDPNFDEKILGKLKEQTLAEILVNENDFDYLAKTNLDALLHSNSRYIAPLIGLPESIQDINLNDIKDFLDLLNLENLYIVLAGDVDEKSINFNEILDVFKNGKKRNLEFIKTSDLCTKNEIKKQSEQAYIYFGAPFYVENSDKFMANVATFILGSSGFGSRLMEEIRVKQGLAYSVYARSDFNLSLSKIWGYMQTKNENKQGAINLIKSEFEKFVKDGVSDEEFMQAKNFLLGNVPLQKETMFQRVAIRQNEFYQGLEFGEFERNLERIRDLSLDELNEFIKSHNEILKLSFAVISNNN
ncbi:insulinase family protein [Campylobacter sp. FMV-PI01]|uniref:Insulinase family protein n=1 Tax=Campylobacter portucalensis TaxID=2608384 RepID=A0A6L5WKN6_9BACT|nr:pitrilysin family protein [Campylobacter portucalensis]MSN96565.1 insulinase family protein [Campylobacter portucalensis]